MIKVDLAPLSAPLVLRLYVFIASSSVAEATLGPGAEHRISWRLEPTAECRPTSFDLDDDEVELYPWPALTRPPDRDASNASRAELVAPRRSMAIRSLSSLMPAVSA